MEIKLNKNKGWQIWEIDDTELDVVPVNDKYSHCFGPDCPCSPNIEVDEGISIVVHNSWDHREVIEEIEAWLLSKRGI